MAPSPQALAKSSTQSQDGEPASPLVRAWAAGTLALYGEAADGTGPPRATREAGGRLSLLRLCASARWSQRPHSPPLICPPLIGPPVTGPPVTGPPVMGPPLTRPRPPGLLSLHSGRQHWSRH